MALSIKDIGEIDQVVGQWCLNRVPPHLKTSVDYDYEIDGQAVTIIEVRPPGKGHLAKSRVSPWPNSASSKRLSSGKFTGCAQAVNGNRMNPCPRQPKSTMP
jgi:hypothetical protein